MLFVCGVLLVNEIWNLCKGSAEVLLRFNILQVFLLLLVEEKLHVFCLLLFID